MPDVKIKGYSGNELHYADVPKVWLAAEESTEDNPVLVPFTYGEAMDDVEIIPDFSAGDMQIAVPDGYLAKSAVVKRPETLVPENVAEGVDIAGIVGALAAGGSNMKIASGTISGIQASKYTVTHNLGVVPDIILFFVPMTISPTRPYSMFGISFSSAMAALCGTGFTVFGGYYSNGNAYVFRNPNLKVDVNGGGPEPGAATATTFVMGSSTFPIADGTIWYAIGGLT